MLEPLPDLDENAVLRMLAAEYGLRGASLRFVPVGEDSWCYRCGDFWVSARRDLRGHVPAAYETAAALKAAGLDFILAPLPGASGRVVHRVGVPILVFPFVESRPLMDATPADAARTIALLQRLHAAQPPRTDLPREDFSLSFAADVETALAIPDGPVPDGGPFGPRLHRLLTRHRDTVASLCDESARLAAQCRTLSLRFVLTHGEPLATNILRTRDGLAVADWGDLALGPPERDWTHVLRTIGGSPPGIRPDVLRFYDVRWILSEIAEYTEVFRGPHGGGADDRGMWTRLTRYLPEQP